MAVRAARAAFASWSTTSPAERAGYLKRAAEGLQLRQTEIATLVSQEVGMPFAYSNVIQVGLPVQSFVSIADIVLSFPFERRVYNSLVVREPIGVVVAITPWNYPLHQIAAKVAPALGAGCTVVLKPSEVAPLNAYVLAEVFDSIGLPPGVFNLVTGTGAGVGETLVAHPEVDMVSLTGSTVAGRRIGAVAAETIKRVSLELGGKSAADRAGRRRYRRGRFRWTVGLLPQLGTDLHRADANDRASVQTGRGRSGGEGRRRIDDCR